MKKNLLIFLDLPPSWKKVLKVLKPRRNPVNKRNGGGGGGLKNGEADILEVWHAEPR